MSNHTIIKMHFKKVLVWGIVLYFLTVISFYSSQIMPLKRQLGYLNQKIKGLSIEVDQLKSQYTKRWEEEKDEVSKIIDSFQYQQGEKEMILSELFRIAKSSGIEIEKAEPLEDEVLSDTMLVYSWRINCYADYPSMGSFFNEIEKSPLFLSVEAPSIQSEEERYKKFSSQPKETITKEKIKHEAGFSLSTYRFK